jgi:hypothetical protein
MISRHSEMKWQYDWVGTELINKHVLVARSELDEPQRQLGGVVLPPDPPSIMNARPEPYAIDEASPASYVTEDDGSFYVSRDILPKYYVSEE